MSSCSPPSNPASRTAVCCGRAVAFDDATPAYRRALAYLVGFVVIAAGSMVAGSASVPANTLEFLADAATYGLSLWAIGESAGTRAGAALIKGASLTAMAAGILGVAVAATGLAVMVTGSRWLDLIVGVLLAVVFLRSAWQITAQARAELATERSGLADFNPQPSKL